MNMFNEEQKAFVERKVQELSQQPGGIEELLRNGGAMPIDQHHEHTMGVSTLSMDKEDRDLLGSLKFPQSTRKSSEIIRTLLTKAGTDCETNDADPCGNGDQRMVKNEAQAQILRELFASGGDLEHWWAEYPFKRSKLSRFVWLCIMGDAKGVENALSNTPLEDRRELLEKRVTSMRFPLLILTIASSKHPQTVHRYTARPPHQMDHIGVIRVLLQYGASPNEREVTGKTGKYLALKRPAL